MENGAAVFILIFAGALLLYAGLMALTKDYRILPRRATISVEPKDPKLYMTRLAKVIALVALAIALGALIGLKSALVGVIVGFAGVIAAIWFGTWYMKDMS